MWYHYETCEVTAQGGPGFVKSAPRDVQVCEKSVPPLRGVPLGPSRANPAKFSNLAIVPLVILWYLLQ